VHRQRAPEEERRTHARDEPSRAPDAGAAAAVLALQRTAGNRAVSAMLARQETADAPAALDAGGAASGGSSLTLGDIGPIPVTTASLRGADSIEVVLELGPDAQRLFAAAQAGRMFPRAVVTINSVQVTLSKVMMSSPQVSNGLMLVTLQGESRTVAGAPTDKPPEDIGHPNPPSYHGSG
jgi:hypothetical protein